MVIPRLGWKESLPKRHKPSKNHGFLADFPSNYWVIRPLRLCAPGCGAKSQRDFAAPGILCGVTLCLTSKGGGFIARRRAMGDVYPKHCPFLAHLATRWWQWRLWQYLNPMEDLLLSWVNFFCVKILNANFAFTPSFPGCRKTKFSPDIHCPDSGLGRLRWFPVLGGQMHSLGWGPKGNSRRHRLSGSPLTC